MRATATAAHPRSLLAHVSPREEEDEKEEHGATERNCGAPGVWLSNANPHRGYDGGGAAGGLQLDGKMNYGGRRCERGCIRRADDELHGGHRRSEKACETSAMGGKEEKEMTDSRSPTYENKSQADSLAIDSMQLAYARKYTAPDCHKCTCKSDTRFDKCYRKLYIYIFFLHVKREKEKERKR